MGVDDGQVRQPHLAQSHPAQSNHCCTPKVFATILNGRRGYVLDHRVGLPAVVEQGPVADLRKALSNASNPGVAFAGRARAGDVVDQPAGGEQAA